MKTKLIFLCTLIFMVFSSPVYPQWVKVSNLPAICFAVNDSNIFAGSNYGLSFSNDNGTTWNDITSGLTTTDVRALALRDSYLFAGTSGGGVFLSTNKGTTWTKVNANLGDSDVRVMAINDQYVFAGTNGGGIFHSLYPAIVWSAGNIGLPATLYPKCILCTGSQTLSGVPGGGMSVGVFISDDGINWGVFGTTGLINNAVWALAKVDNYVIAGTKEGGAGGVFASTGADWIEGDLPYNVEALAVDSTFAFAGTSSNGVFLSENHGLNWTAVNTGLTNLEVTALAVKGEYLYAGTQPGGIWRRPLSDFSSGIPSIRGNANNVTLEQNFPNPFSANTTIDYSLSFKALVTLKVFSVYGKEVATLSNQEMLPGQYHLTWDAASFPEGIYTCRLQIGQFVLTRKLILIR
jgi:hypothetical protein